MTRAEDLECDDCHVKIKGKSRIEGNAALKEYLETDHITIKRWDEEAGMLLAPTGSIPVPPDWQEALLFDFAYYLGDATDLIVKDPDGVIRKAQSSRLCLFFTPVPEQCVYLLANSQVTTRYVEGKLQLVDLGQ